MEKDDITFKLGAIESTVNATHQNVLDLKKWLIEHEKKDKLEFESVRGEISSMNRYGASIAIIASAVGWGASWLWSRLTNGS